MWVILGKFYPPVNPGWFKTHILNVLHRLIDGKAPPASPIDAPQALRLAQEPVADVERYDTLRALRHAS